MRRNPGTMNRQRRWIALLLALGIPALGMALAVLVSPAMVSTPQARKHSLIQ